MKYFIKVAISRHAAKSVKKLNLASSLRRTKIDNLSDEISSLTMPSESIYPSLGIQPRKILEKELLLNKLKPLVKTEDQLARFYRPVSKMESGVERRAFRDAAKIKVKTPKGGAFRDRETKLKYGIPALNLKSYRGGI